MAIEITEDVKQELVAAIRHYFAEERGEEIGDLQASLMLDYILEEIGPTIYNQAVKDSQARLQSAVADLDVGLYEPEFRYSMKQAGAGKSVT